MNSMTTNDDDIQTRDDYNNSDDVSGSSRDPNSSQLKTNNNLNSDDIYPHPKASPPESSYEISGNTDQTILDTNNKNKILKSIFALGGLLVILLAVAIAGISWYLYNASNEAPANLIAYEFDGSKLCYWVDGRIVTSTEQIAETKLETRMVSADEEADFLQQAQDNGWCVTKVAEDAKPQTTVASDVEQVPQQSESILKETIYPATSKNPDYKLLFFSDTTSICDQTASLTCGKLIGRTEYGRDIHLTMYDLSKYNDGYLTITDDNQCKIADISAQNAGKNVSICEAVFSGRVVYYKFQLELGSRQHVGVLTGVATKGAPFLDMTSYDDEVIEMIESLRLI